jgi:VCBS repeat-containing protein
MAVFTPISQDTIAQDPTAITNALLPATPGLSLDASTLQVVSGATSIGFYDGSLSALGIGPGLLLTSGTMPGTGNTAGFFGIDNGMPGDPALDAVVNTVFNTVSLDATTLSVNFTVTDPTITGISFNVVFGSDEYPEWVNQFVDIGAILVNGVNVAYFNHDPHAPLSVIGSNLAANYFIDNTGNLTTPSFGGVAVPGVASTLPIEYDGISAPLTVFAPVHMGVNTLMIGIADTRDHIYDSGLFISNMVGTNLPISGVTLALDGTPGDDNIQGTQAAENIQALDGNDNVQGAGGDDIVQAGAGDDIVNGGAGNDYIEGGAGIDTATYSGASSDYYVVAQADGSYEVTDLRSGSPDGVDTLLNVEQALFSDGTFDLQSLQLTAYAPVVSGPVTLTVDEASPPTISNLSVLEVEALEANGVAPAALPNTIIMLANASDLNPNATLSVADVPAVLPAGVSYVHTPAYTDFSGYYGAPVYHPSVDGLVIDPSDPSFQSLAQGETMTITIDYGVTNGTLTTPATAVFTVVGTNDAPVVTGAVTVAATEDSAAATVDALANASDVDHGAVLSVVDVPAALPAGVSFDAATHSYTLDPTEPAYQNLSEGQARAVTVNYGVSDGIVTTAASATFTVTGTNDAPWCRARSPSRRPRIRWRASSIRSPTPAMSINSTS